MIVYSEKVDKKKWDACINSSANSSVFATSAYLDSVCDNWSGLISNDYEAVFPIVWGSKYRIKYVYQPFFTRYFGVYSKTEPSEKLVSDFIQAIPDQFKYMEFCMHEQNSVSDKEIEKKERKFQFLDLNRSYESVFKTYSENAKRSIKKAIKSGAQIKEGIDPNEIVDLFKHTKGRELEVFAAKDYQRLLHLMDVFKKNKSAESIAVYHADGTLSAAGFFLKYKNRYIFLKSGVTEYGKTHGYMHLLFDHFIKKHSESECILDFGGSSVESVARFYNNFGAKDCVYLQVKKNRLPKLVNWIKSLKS
ncbi:MAG: hypothetical protein K0S44_1613 [Bacteroidetes bacterium]|jgi:hypothetical protein|nr:hypothetical protein [Bacteroidota bacterium]